MKKPAAAILFAIILAFSACDDPSTNGAVPELPANTLSEYAPAGWPLAVGDRITFKRLVELQAEFPSRLGDAENAVGDTVYTAKWDVHKGALPGEDPQFLPTTSGQHDRYVHVVYAGHYPWDRWPWGVRVKHSTTAGTMNTILVFYGHDRSAAQQETWAGVPRESRGRGIVR